MHLDPQNSLPTVNLEAPDFAELLRLIQAGETRSQAQIALGDQRRSDPGASV